MAAKGSLQFHEMGLDDRLLKVGVWLLGTVCASYELRGCVTCISIYM